MDTLPAEFVITDGSIEYRRMRPLGEYDTKTPMVKWNFQVAEGSDPFVVTSQLMEKAIGIVEGASGHKPTQIKELPGVAGTPKPVGRPRKPPVEVPVEDAAAITDDETTDLRVDEVAEAQHRTQGGEEPPPLTLKDDIQPLAQRVSAKLRKTDGNINKLKKTIADAGGQSLLTIPQENWPAFIKAANELLKDA
jgi:hypothetical protein